MSEPGSRASRDDIPEWKSVTLDSNSAATTSFESPNAGSPSDSISEPGSASNLPRTELLNIDNLPDGPQMFQPLVTEDEDDRNEFAAGLVQHFTESLEALKANYLLVVRFAYEIPFANIRQMFQELLEANKARPNPNTRTSSPRCPQSQPRPLYRCLWFRNLTTRS